MRLKGFKLKLLLCTYFLVIQPIENFLLALEVGWVRFRESQKVLKIMDFEPLRVSMGNAGTQFLVKAQIEHRCSRMVAPYDI